MVILFVFHANWMPRATTNVMKSHVRNRRELWKLLRGQGNPALEKPPSMESLKKEGFLVEVPGKNEEVKKQHDEEPKSKALANQAAAAAAAVVASGPVSVELSASSGLPYTKNNSPNLPLEQYDLSKQQYHVIFSTGCSTKQHWQSYMLYYSIISSGQTGQVTRIASGCTDEESQQLAQIHKDQIEPMGKIGLAEGDPTRFHLHMTPEFGKDFHYNNKPYGVAHWMENVLGYSQETASTEHDDTILFLLDPDMVFMRPFVNDFTHQEMWVPRKSFPRITRVQHGYPMASGTFIEF